MAQSVAVGRGWRLVTDLTTRRVPERQEPDRSPDPADPRERPGADVPPVVSGGVPLTRLLAVARLSAAQALEIAAALLAATEVDAATRGGDGCDRLLPDPVVTTDGRVAIGSTGPARPLDGVLAEVAAAVPSPGPVADPAVGQRLAELDRAVQDLPGAGLPVVARRLQEAAAAIDRTAVRAELAALVRAVRGAGGSAGGVARSAVRARPAGRAPRRARSAGRRIGAWSLSILVLAAVVVSEVVLLRDDITADIGQLMDAGRGGDEPSTAPQPDGP